jgi:hypothetical protein
MRWRSALLTASSALALAACGGGDGEQAEQRQMAPGPRIDAAVAEPLAERSENVARLLDGGDPCAAADEAARLEQDVIAAINDGAIPEVYLEDLGNVAHELAAQVPPCKQPAPPPPPPPPRGDGDD